MYSFPRKRIKYVKVEYINFTKFLPSSYHTINLLFDYYFLANVFLRVSYREFFMWISEEVVYGLGELGE